MLSDAPWWIDRLIETAVGQARLGDAGPRRHRSGLERYADDKPVTDEQGNPDGTAGERRLGRDLDDPKLRARLLAQGGVNARASDLLDEVRNMLGSWVRDVCERRGVDVPFITTAQSMAVWLANRVASLASAECADDTFSEVRKAIAQMERAVNRPPSPKTCGPCPTPGVHTDKGFVPGDSRSKCGTRLEARETASQIQCPTCKQTHDVESLITRLMNETHYMHYTIPELCQTVLPRLGDPIPQQTLQRWHAKGELQPRGWVTTTRGKTIPQFMLADVRRVKHQMAVRRIAK